MPLSRYLKVTIGDKQVQVTNPEDLPISIDYALEDPDNFQTKTSAQALSVKIPATKLNDIAANTFRNPDMVDLTTDNVFKSNQPFNIDENGFEILTGKAFLKSGTHNFRPIDYTYDFYGDNADWKIDLADSTLFDFLKYLNFDLTPEEIIASWDFDGTDPAKPYVFAPIRFRDPMGGTSLDDQGKVVADDVNMLPIYMKPSISKYWIIFNAFKSIGYRVVSAFMDSDKFRRQVMPWAWGNFLDSDGTRLNTHLFLAKSTKDVYYSFPNGYKNFIWNLDVSNDNGSDGSGGFDNNNDYAWNAGTLSGEWTYNTPDYGALEATFDMQIDVNARLNGESSNIKLEILWYKNGVLQQTDTPVNLGGTLIGGRQDIDIKDVFFTTTVSQGDVVSAKYRLSGSAAKLGFASITANVLEFKLAYFRIPLGGVIDFNNYTGLQNYKFLDFFKGVIDEFNMSLKADAKNKILYIEPTHAYPEGDDFSVKQPGYFKEDFISWDGKEDLSQTWEMDNYSDFNRELTFKYKDDSNDGILKLIQDRNLVTLASGKYVFPKRFQTGKSSIENSFFAATMHYEVDQWKGLGTGSNTGISPQMVCMVPENISNTSKDSSQNTFIPKSCYYKGNIEGVGAWKFNGVVYQTFPYMFSVNYKPGGQNDPILSYSDEKISNGTGGYVIGKGLLKRYYWQRLAIIRNGQWYNCWFRLKNVDVANQLHREYKSYKGQLWELINITNYQPLAEKPSQVLMRRWAPVSQEDFNNTYPSSANVLSNNSTDKLDIKYALLKCLPNDIPVL